MTLEELQRLNDAATPGPWHTNYMHDVCSVNDDSLAAMFVRGPMEQNSTLIAAARNALPALLAVAKAAMTMLEESTPVPNSAAIEVRNIHVEELAKALNQLEAT